MCCSISFIVVQEITLSWCSLNLNVVLPLDQQWEECQLKLDFSVAIFVRKFKKQVSSKTYPERQGELFW